MSTPSNNENNTQQSSRTQSSLSPSQAQSSRSPTSPYVTSPRSATTQGSTGSALWSPRTDQTGASSQVPSPTSPGWNGQQQEIAGDIMGQLDAMLGPNNGGGNNGGGN
ncbi:hypothetical protein L198_02125 [Cryptococcus wingfieldii CBS 7118]|uniref:Uncharacterized protein n=1 Tax=Cryptococcus wingfieldii CBS 7118 TaxID=1295528 RepID=A0A1E3JZV3_9TREE|nr:hypothetical protein L198_02125 [Cryptococcus wingfieldii CBS 7118]ODO05432.1 hypothetical protein L198_02125 [Cryptococcus wingfieldii CBS 7118]